jgi:hypothetical protein
MDKIQKHHVTGAVVALGIAGLVTAAALGVDKETIAAIGAALVAIAGAMASYLGGAKKDGAS